MTYHVTKAKGRWHITRVQPGWVTPVGSFPKRKQAILTASILAGPTGKVVVHGKRPASSLFGQR